MLYEILLLAALLLVSGFLFVGITQKIDHVLIRPIFQLALLLICGTYFVWFWVHGGQTVAMRAWHLKLIADSGASISSRIGIFRFILAVASAGLFGSGFIWALFDRDKKFLHDRIIGTSIVIDGRYKISQS
jgi:uncharacterized RDD family membrane protein YckC